MNLSTAALRALGTSLARQDRALDIEDPRRVARTSVTPAAAIEEWICAARDANDGDLITICRSARRRRTVEVAWAREVSRVAAS